MKKILLTLFIISAFAFHASAQEKFNINNFDKYVGKKATLCDTVFSYKILSDSVTLLNMGGEYPHQTFTVAITGKEIQLNYDDIKGKHICVTGDISSYKGRAEVLIYHPNQIEFK
jgi:hypothetical protein